MSNGDKDIPAGSAVRIKRDDGSDRTLLRSRPTNSRADDAFVTPKAPITGDDRLVLLETTSAEGTSFSHVRTSSGVEGYVQSKYEAAFILRYRLFVTNKPGTSYLPLPLPLPLPLSVLLNHHQIHRVRSSSNPVCTSKIAAETPAPTTTSPPPTRTTGRLQPRTMSSRSPCAGSRLAPKQVQLCCGKMAVAHRNFDVLLIFLL